MVVDGDEGIGFGTNTTGDVLKPTVGAGLGSPSASSLSSSSAAAFGAGVVSASSPPHIKASAEVGGAENTDKSSDDSSPEMARSKL